MAHGEFVSHLVGWFGDRFERGGAKPFDEETASQQGFVYSARFQLRRVRCIYDDKSIRDFQFSFDNLLERPTSDSKKEEFTFNAGERMTSLAVYLSFTSQEKERSHALSGSVGAEEDQTKTPLLTTEDREDVQQSDVPEVEMMAFMDTGRKWRKKGTSEVHHHDTVHRPTPKWGLKEARLCGIQFTTNQKRNFKVISGDPFLFKTRYDIDVESGICVGLLERHHPTEPNVMSGLGFVFIKGHGLHMQMQSDDRRGRFGWCCRLLPVCIEMIESFIEIVQDLPQLIPFVVLSFVSTFRNLVLHVVLPLFDVVSDILAGYYYYEDHTYIITGCILLFVLLPHILLSLMIIWEMIVDVGAFDEYPNVIVGFYKSKPTMWNVLNNIIKFLTLPLFTIFNFVHFFIVLFGMALKLLRKMFCSFAFGFLERVGQRHPKNIRQENVKQDAWSKITLMELFFETIPQLMTQVSALVAANESGLTIKFFMFISSIAVSILNFSYQSYTLFSFMKLTHLTLFNTIRYTLSSALDFFPIFNLYKNSVDRVLLQFYDNPILLELWGPLKMVLKRNTSLKVLTIYLEEARDWMDMSLELLDILTENDRLKMDTLDLCIEADDIEEANRVIQHHIPEIKKRIYALLEKGTVKKVYLLVHSMVNIGIADAPAEELNTLSLTVDGMKWSWDWPVERSSKIEYCIEMPGTDED